MTGYPELDDIYQQLADLQARSDYDSREWHLIARDIYVALNPIVDQVERMEAWVNPAWDWLGENQQHPQWGERMKKWLLTSAKHTAYKRLLASAHATLTASPKSEGLILSSESSSTAPVSTSATPSPGSGRNTGGTGTREPVGSLITRIRTQTRNSSQNGALSATP